MVMCSLLNRRCDHCQQKAINAEEPSATSDIEKSKSMKRWQWDTFSDDEEFSAQTTIVNAPKMFLAKSLHILPLPSKGLLFSHPNAMSTEIHSRWWGHARNDHFHQSSQQYQSLKPVSTAHRYLTSLPSFNQNCSTGTPLSSVDTNQPSTSRSLEDDGWMPSRGIGKRTSLNIVLVVNMQIVYPWKYNFWKCATINWQMCLLILNIYFQC